jgi:hypothetical protein
MANPEHGSQNRWRTRFDQRPPLALPVLGCVLALLTGYALIEIAQSHETRARQDVQRTRDTRLRWQTCLEKLDAYTQSQATLQRHLNRLEENGLFVAPPVRLWQQRLLAPQLRELADKREVRISPAAEPTTQPPEMRAPGLRWHSLHLEARPPHEDAALALVELLLQDLPGRPHIQSCRWSRSPDAARGLNLGCDLLWPLVSTPSAATPELPPECPTANSAAQTASAAPIRNGSLR